MHRSKNNLNKACEQVNSLERSMTKITSRSNLLWHHWVRQRLISQRKSCFQTITKLSQKLKNWMKKTSIRSRVDIKTSWKVHLGTNKSLKKYWEDCLWQMKLIELIWTNFNPDYLQISLKTGQSTLSLSQARQTSRDSAYTRTDSETLFTSNACFQRVGVMWKQWPHPLMTTLWICSTSKTQRK